MEEAKFNANSVCTFDEFIENVKKKSNLENWKVKPKNEIEKDDVTSVSNSVLKEKIFSNMKEMKNKIKGSKLERGNNDEEYRE